MAARVEDLGWLAGRWRGEAFGGVADEVWSAPEGGALVAMYRLVKEDAVTFYELATISEEDGGLVLRIRHFHPDLVAWEEKDAPQAFPLIRLGEREAEFDGIAYRLVDDDTLRVRLRIQRKGGPVAEDVHRYRRVRDG